ncbi:hypothetical protein EVAR_98487_1 [Eumeta japonica]|uniref:Uncharacterized protein n=1 Tax=Eumeta variegata TaxID=151549 RepID=A0A4C1YHU8_EUMVA|nr:hypothetical protein EVAR_98487_1 [Eumeta japonica]
MPFAVTAHRAEAFFSGYIQHCGQRLENLKSRKAHTYSPSEALVNAAWNGGVIYRLLGVNGICDGKAMGHRNSNWLDGR